jgi:hypothetical protein
MLLVIGKRQTRRFENICKVKKIKPKEHLPRKNVIFSSLFLTLPLSSRNLSGLKTSGSCHVAGSLRAESKSAIMTASFGIVYPLKVKSLVVE